MPAFFDANVVFHTHIEKTAGSSLVRGFVRAFGPEHVCDLRKKEQIRPAEMHPEAKRRVYVLTGHFHYGTQDAEFGRAKIYVACVRPPLERFRSYYDFVRVRPLHPGFSKMAGQSFKGAVENLLSSKRVNVMARSLTGLGHPEQDETFATVEQKYAIVTPYHRVNDTLLVLLPLIGGRRLRNQIHMNKVKSETVEDIGELEQAFNEANALDIALYDYVSTRYDTWLGDLASRVRSLAAGQLEDAHHGTVTASRGV